MFFRRGFPIGGTNPLALPLTVLVVLMLSLAAPGAALARGAPDSFADLAERLSPAVVNISTTQVVERPKQQIPQLPPGAPFKDFFKDFFDRQQSGPRTMQSLGSGFVIDPKGYIVTNNHVIDGADEITVNLPDGTSLPAKLLGHDPKTDIALLKIEPKTPLTAVPFGDSAGARVGDWVLAIGNPFGLGGSVSAGIISARNRNINAGPYDDFIQTDAAINRGNSGGPLFNMDGEVVGVNTAIISPSGGSIGIGFSVPSNIVKSVVAQLRKYGETRRGWLGVRIQTVTSELAEALGLESKQGALVAGVTETGPAEAAGINAGDVILKFDGHDVAEMKDLPRMVAETKVGKSVRVLIWRKGKTQTVKVVLGRLEEGEKLAAADEAADSTGSADAQMTLGMSLEPLTAEKRKSYGINGDVKGVLVVNVAADSSAAEKGVRAGDVLVEVAQEKVATPAEVQAKVDTAKAGGKRSVLLLIHANGDLRFVPVRLPE